MNYKFKNFLLFPMNFIYKINPVYETKLMFFLKNRYKLNLAHPTTFNEKIQWIKFYDKNIRMTYCADKFEVRGYVKECGCEEILNHLLWEGYNASDIPFDCLPSKFVIKVTHGSGFNIICKNKDDIKRNKVIKQIKRWLNATYIPCYGEWFYGIVKPRILIEEYLTGSDGLIPHDYKVYCFDGEPRIIQVHIGRFTNHRMKIYDSDWNPIDNVTMKYSSDSQYFLEKPKNFHKLLEYSKILSKPFHHARIDFYVIEEKVYFGEITFTDGAGFDRITPYSFDVQLGSYMKLPSDDL